MKEDRLVNHTSDVTAEACAWIAQLETGDMTRADIDAFREWMHRSPCQLAARSVQSAVPMSWHVFSSKQAFFPQVRTLEC